MATAIPYIGKHEFDGNRGHVTTLLIGTERGTDSAGHAYRKGLNLSPGSAVQYLAWLRDQLTNPATYDALHAVAQDVDSLAETPRTRATASVGITPAAMAEMIQAAVREALAAAGATKQGAVAATAPTAPTAPKGTGTRVPGPAELRAARAAK